MLIAAVTVFYGLAAMILLAPAPRAHSDYFNYPCTYPFVGMQVDVKVGVDAGGQFCDGPTEINGAHYHCQSMGATVGGGGLAFAPLTGSPINLGGFGGGGIGGSGGSCDYRCPDGTLAPFPNPPGVWERTMVIPKLNFCNGHETPQGWSSALNSPNEGGLGSGPGVPPPGTPPLGPNGLPAPVPIPPAEPLPPDPNAPPPLPGPQTPPPASERRQPPPQEPPSTIDAPVPVPPVPGVPIP